MTFGALFPGQGSQSLGMLSELNEKTGVVGLTFSEASDALGYDLWALTQDGPVEQLNQTEYTQPAMLTAGVAVWRAFKEVGGGKLPAVVAGHSLGEYTALVCAESLNFVDAVKLVQTRGALMQSAMPEGQGGMAAVLGLEDDVISHICQQQALQDVVAPANFNSPAQVVVAGHSDALDRVLIAAKEAGAKRAVKLAVSVPCHSVLMKPASEQFDQALNAVEIAQPYCDVVMNVDGAAARDPIDIRNKLSSQLYSPVQWVRSVQCLGGFSQTFVEMGPGKVLTGLMKRIDRSLQALPVFDPITLNYALEELKNV